MVRGCREAAEDVEAADKEQRMVKDAAEKQQRMVKVLQRSRRGDGGCREAAEDVEAAEKQQRR